MHERIKGIAAEMLEAGSPKGPNKNKTYRDSIFDKIKGPNEKRFEPFNNMPRIFSKYKINDGLISIDKQCTRDESIIGGENGIGPKKDLYLMDYKGDSEITKSQLNLGCKLA